MGVAAVQAGLPVVDQAAGHSRHSRADDSTLPTEPGSVLGKQQLLLHPSGAGAAAGAVGHPLQLKGRGRQSRRWRKGRDQREWGERDREIRRKESRRGRRER